MTKNIKQIIIALVLIIIAFFGFKYFFVDKDSRSSSLVAEETSTSTFVDGQVILSLLNQLDKVSLDVSVFSNEIFASLVSFEQPIPEQVIGRPNPFLPIGRDSGLVLPANVATTSRR